MPQTAADAFSPCTSPITYPVQADGTYRFVVQDNGGNSLSFLFTIDTVAPAITLSQNPPNPDLNPSATFAWTSSEPGTFQCSFGPAGAANATSVVRTLAVSPTNNSTPATTYRYRVRGGGYSR